jgi:hypothetical protein
MKKNDGGHVPRKEKRRVGGFGGGDLMERDRLEHLSIDGKTILKWSFKK